MNWSNESSYPLTSANLLRARKSIEEEREAVVNCRIEWGAMLAKVIQKYGQRAVNRMSGERLNALLDGRDGIAVKHYSERTPGEVHERRWTTQRVEYVRVRTCRGKRT